MRAPPDRDMTFPGITFAMFHQRSRPTRINNRQELRGLIVARLASIDILLRKDTPSVTRSVFAIGNMCTACTSQEACEDEPHSFSTCAGVVRK